MRNSYKKLIIWQKSMDLVVDVYNMTKLLPKDEMYGLISQIRRAVVSIPSNIAEGNSRNTTKEYIHFLYIAYGSLAEIETQIEVCIRLLYITNEQVEDILCLCSEIGKMINSIIKKLT